MRSGDTAAQMARDEAQVRSGFWPKLRQLAGRLPFAEDLVTAYYCAFDAQTPLRVRATLLGALAYFVLPFDFMPDMLPLLGFADDAAVLAGALKLVIDHIRPEHRDAARQALRGP
ncbi:MAG: YkvA family protein [Pseudorhodoplanes sp.]